MKKINTAPEIFREWLKAFCQTWRMLFDIPLPGQLEESAGKEEDAHSSKILCCFVLAGLKLGVIAYLTGWLLSLLAGRSAAAILCGVVLTAGYELITRGRNLSTGASLAEIKSDGAPLEEVYNLLDDDFKSRRSITGSITAASLFTVRLLCVVFIVRHGDLSWLITVMILGFTAQAYLASLQEAGRSEPIIDTDDEKLKFIPWILALPLVVLFGIYNLAPVLVAFIAAFILAFLSGRLLMEKIGGVTGKLVGLAGYLLETLLMILGLVLLR